MFQLATCQLTLQQVLISQKFTVEDVLQWWKNVTQFQFPGPIMGIKKIVETTTTALRAVQHITKLEVVNQHLQARNVPEKKFDNE